MRVLKEKWVDDNWFNLNFGEDNQDFKKEIIPTPNFDDLTDYNIVNFLEMMEKEKESKADDIKCDIQEISANNMIPDVLLNNDISIDSISLDIFDKFEIEIVDIEETSKCKSITAEHEALDLSVSEMNDVQNLDMQLKLAAHEKYYADIYIENTVMELRVADLHSKYPHLYNLPI